MFLDKCGDSLNCSFTEVASRAVFVTLMSNENEQEEYQQFQTHRHKDSTKPDKDNILITV